MPSWLISLVFHIRASYRLLSFSFHDNRACHSRDTIWPWKFKVKGTSVSIASSWLISLVFHMRASHRLPSLSFHNNWASHSWGTIWPWKFKVKGHGQRYPSQHSIQLTHVLFVSHQLDQSLLRYGQLNVWLGKTDLKFNKNKPPKTLKNFGGRINKKFSQVESAMRGKYIYTYQVL